MTSSSQSARQTPEPGGRPPGVGGPRRGGAEYWPGLLAAALGLLIIVLVYFILRELGVILRPLLIAAFLCYLIIPAHHWLVRHRVPSMLAYFVIVGGVLTVSYGLGGMLLSNLTRVAGDLPSYVVTLEAAADTVVRDVKLRFSHLLPDERPASSEPADLADEPGREADAPATRPTGAVPGTRPAASPPEEARFRLLSTERLIALGRSAAEASVGLATMAMVVVFYLIFLLAEAAGFDRRVVAAFGPERAGRIMSVIAKINAAVAQYIIVKTFVSALIGGLTTAVLFVFGVQFAVMWGILTFFANFIPYVGSLAAVILPVLMSFIECGTLGKPLLLFGLLSVAHQIIGNVVEPQMVGHKLGVSPLVILLALAFWGFLWGITGMILAAPLMVSLKIVLENIEQTRPIARMMSDR